MFGYKNDQSIAKLLTKDNALNRLEPVQQFSVMYTAIFTKQQVA
jgi:hypothetical protein